MLTTLVTAVLPLATQLGLYWINLYITDAAQNRAATDAFLAFIAAHKQDGVSSGSAKDNYEEQVSDLGKP